VIFEQAHLVAVPSILAPLAKHWHFANITLDLATLEATVAQL
jgi:hypothetical protein